MSFGKDKAGNEITVGHNIITGLDAGSDGHNIVLPKSLYNSLKGQLKRLENGGANWKIDNTDSTAKGAPDSVRDFINVNADGFFETQDTGGGFSGGPAVQNSVAEVKSTVGGGSTTTWLFIDVDGNGDYDGAIDMAIHVVVDQNFNFDVDGGNFMSA